MDLKTLKSQLGDFAKDIKLNISSVLSEEGAPDLSQSQIYQIALASAYATQKSAVVEAIQQEVSTVLSDIEQNAAKAAATIMAMNNIYYRFVHLVEDKEYSKLPAKLRMNVMANPGIPKVDFELMSLAVSAINGCGLCLDAHVHELKKVGISSLGVQSCVRIAAVINALAQSVAIQKI